MTNKQDESTAASLARFDERMKAIENNLAELKTSVTANIEALRVEIRAGLGTMRNTQDDHEKRIAVLEAAERQRIENERKCAEQERERLSWVRPVVTGVVTLAMGALLAALAYVLVNFSPLFK